MRKLTIATHLVYLQQYIDILIFKKCAEEKLKKLNFNESAPHN